MDFLGLLNTSDDYCLSIEFDHWSDKGNRSLLGVVSSYTNGSRYLVSLEDVSLKGHSADAIVDSLKAIIAKLPASKINAFVSDSASSWKAARERLVDVLDGHYIQHRCFAHIPNRMGEKLQMVSQCVRSYRME